MANGLQVTDQDDPLAALRKARDERQSEIETERGADDPLQGLRDARDQRVAQEPIPGREAPPQPEEPGVIRRVTRSFRERGPLGPVRDFIGSRRRARDQAEVDTGERPGGFRVPEGKVRDPFSGRIVDAPEVGPAASARSLSEALGSTEQTSIDAPQLRPVRAPHIDTPDEKAAKAEEEFQVALAASQRGVASDQPIREDVAQLPDAPTLREVAGSITGAVAEKGRNIARTFQGRELTPGDVTIQADALAIDQTIPPRPETFRRPRNPEEMTAALARATERDQAALQARYDAFPLPVRMAHSAVRGAFNAPAVGHIDILVAKANSIVAAAFGVDAPALTTAQVFDIVDRGLLDKGAGGAGFLLGAGGVISGTNRLVAGSAQFARAGTRTRAILESFDPNNPVALSTRVLQGAVEGVPFDLAFKAENTQERMINLAAGLVIGGALGPVFGGRVRREGDLDPRQFDSGTARGNVRRPVEARGFPEPSVVPTRVRRTPLAQQPLRQVLQEETARLERGAARVAAADAPPPRTLEAGPPEQPGPGFIGPETVVDPETGLRVDPATGELIERGVRAVAREASPGRRVDDLGTPPDPNRLTIRERVTGTRNPARDIEERTGLLSQSAFERALVRVQGPKDPTTQQLLDPTAGDPTLEVVMFDLVNFKSINDLVSEAAGNAKLREIADIIRDHSGVSNRQIFRAGGDEFSLIVPTGTGEAIGRRIQEIVGESRIGDSEFSSSIRFGVGQSDLAANAAMAGAKKGETGPRFRGAGGRQAAAAADPSDVTHTRTSADRFNPEVEVRTTPTGDGPSGNPRVRPRDAADPMPREIPAGRQANNEGGFFALGDAVEVGTKAVRGFFRRHFTSAGDLPQNIFRLKMKADQWVAAQMSEVRFNLRRYEDKLNELYGSDGPSPEVKQQINDAMRGKLDFDELDPELAPIVRRLREHTDGFSSQMMESGMVKGELVPVIADNMGVYLSRSYRVFEDPNWIKANIPKDIVNRAENIIRLERPDISAEEMDGIIEGILSKQVTSPLQFLSGGTIGSKDLSMLTRRKDIHPAIRALMGEFEDVKVNYARSVEKMGNALANHEFLSEVARSNVGTPGRAGGFFFQDRVVRGDDKFITQIAATGSETMAPLNGLYTTPEIAQAFETAFSRQAQQPGWLNTYMKANGLVKFDKTVLSLMTHVRNVLGNVGFAVANGHWRMQHLGRAIEAANAGIGGTAALRRGGRKIGLDIDAARQLTPDQIRAQERRLRLEESGGLLSPWERYYQNLQALGVVDQSAHAGELRAVVQDAMRGGLDNINPNANLVQRAGRGFIGKVADIYRAEDDLWKVIAFENEFTRYRNAMPGASQTDVEETAAWIVRNTYPTYSMVPSGIRAFRRNIAVGSFTSFPAEVFRTMYHTIDIAMKEVKSDNAAIRKIGAERLAGIAAATTLVPGAVTASRFFTGVDRQMDEDARPFVAPWQRNSQLIWLSKDEGAKADYVDISYTDPHSYARDAILAALSGENWQEALMNSVLQATAPFLGEEILFAKVLDWRRNTTPDGRRVFNEEDHWIDKSRDILAHFYDALEPGTITAGRRIKAGLEGRTSPTGRVFDPVDEIKAVLTGTRRQTVDIGQSLQFRSRAFSGRLRDANSILTGVANRAGTVSEEELTEAFRDSQRSRERLFEEAHEVAESATRWGLTSTQVERSFREGGMSRADARAVIEGFGPPRRRVDAGNPERNAILRALEEEAGGGR